MHSPVVSELWRFGTLGHLTESNVLLLQGILGVLGALMLYFLVKQIVRDFPAAVVSLVITSLPIMLFTERTLMTEAAVQFTILVGLCATYVMCTRRGWQQIAAFLAAALACGVAASLRPSLDLPSFVLVIGVVLAFIVLQSGNTIWAKVKRSYLSVLLALFLAVVPIGVLTYKYHNGLHVNSPSPASGLVLAGRFGPLLSCNPPASDLPEVQTAIRQLCKLHFTAIPGFTVQQIWGGGALTPVFANHPDLAVASSQLQAATISAILHHPIDALKQVTDSLVFQLKSPPIDVLFQYWTGRGWQSPESLAAFPDSATWFGNNAAPQSSAYPFRSLVSGTLRIPQLMADFALLLGLGALVVRYRTRKQTPRTPLPFGLRAMGWFAAVIVVGGMLSVAVGSEPGFRYWTILIPSLTVLICLGLPRRFKRAPSEAEPVHVAVA
jgi:4-amino-4-deoxy-L-arabinose transferase-like glycosyltransferase